uniref:Uncharacterized protein n=1 Tax=Sphaerodactylus townsendi TaxID=933632 RepID=A0ACB8F256_9SAUR
MEVEQKKKHTIQWKFTTIQGRLGSAPLTITSHVAADGSSTARLNAGRFELHGPGAGAALGFLKRLSCRRERGFPMEKFSPRWSRHTWRWLRSSFPNGGQQRGRGTTEDSNQVEIKVRPKVGGAPFFDFESLGWRLEQR